MAMTPAELAVYNKNYREKIKRDKEIYKAFEPLDADGVRYKSEVLAYRELLNLFFGIRPELEDEKDEEKKKYRKRNIVRPCGKDFLGVKLETTVESFKSWLDLRDKARKDL